MAIPGAIHRLNKRLWVTDAGPNDLAALQIGLSPKWVFLVVISVTLFDADPTKDEPARWYTNIYGIGRLAHLPSDGTPFYTMNNRLQSTMQPSVVGELRVTECTAFRLRAIMPMTWARTWLDRHIHYIMRDATIDNISPAILIYPTYNDTATPSSFVSTNTNSGNTNTTLYHYYKRPHRRRLYRVGSPDPFDSDDVDNDE